MKKEGQQVKLVGDQSPSPEAFPRNKSWRVWVFERKEIPRNDPIKYLLSTGVRSIF